MSDREKIIAQCEWAIKQPSPTIIEAKKFYKEVLEVLKEQDAVKPKKESDGAHQPWTTWWYVCGSCGEQINTGDKYCHECGTPVEWER